MTARTATVRDALAMTHDLNEAARPMHIKMYTKAHCSYCFAAKNLLASRGLAFEEVPVAGDSVAEQEMRDLTRARTVPQILIDGRPIGGYAELVELDRQGGLRGA